MATAIQRALGLLGLFTESRPSMGLSDMAVLSGLPKSTVQRLLNELAAAGFVSQDPYSKQWSLGVRTLELAYLYRRDLSLHRIAHPHMTSLARLSEETVTLVIQEGDTGICIERVDSEEELRLQTRIGSREPLYAGASRKAILASMPDQRIESIISEDKLKQLTEQTVTDRRAMLHEIQRIRKQGYAISNSERNAGVVAVAAAIHCPRLEILASVGITGPERRFTEARALGLAPSVVEAASAITRELTNMASH